MFAPTYLMLKVAEVQTPADVSSGNCPSRTGRLQLAPAFEVLSASNVQICVLSTHDEPTAQPSTALLNATSDTPMFGTLLGVGVGPGVKQGLP
jgi:hypothetical protein